MPPLLIVDKLLLLAQLRGAGLQMQQPASSVDAVQDIVGYLSLALGLLSMQRDRSDALSASVVEGKERHEVKGDRELEVEVEGAGRAHDPDLAVADTQLKSLWAIALRVQESLWLDIVVSSSLKNAQGEDGRDGDALYSASDGLMSSSVFGLLIAECNASAREGLLRRDMIPSVPGPDEEEEEEEGGGAGVDGELLENNQRSRLSLKSLLSSLDFSNSPDWQRMQHLVLGSDTAQLKSPHR
jgi:hypothetical protein